MKSIAAYYTFIAVNSLEQEAVQRRTQVRAPKPSRPSLVARARGLLGSRSAQPATSAA